MIIEILLASSDGLPPIALGLLERTASTPRVQQVVQLSLAPAFLLGGIGAVMNVIMARMIWIAGRIERIEDLPADDRTQRQLHELGWLESRRRAAQTAVQFTTASAVIISLVIGLLFISAYITSQIGTIIAVLWVVTMLLLMTGLAFFLMETRMAARGARIRRK